MSQLRGTGIDVLGKHTTLSQAGTGLALRPANERRGYIITTSLIGWAHHIITTFFIGWAHT